MGGIRDRKFLCPDPSQAVVLIALSGARHPKSISLKPPILGDKNFWFFYFSCILASETVESSYLNSLTTGIFQIPFDNKINNKTDWVISISINNSFLCTTFCS